MKNKQHQNNIPDIITTSSSEDNFDETTNTDNDITDVEIDLYW